jgi:hypothetical protein
VKGRLLDVAAAVSLVLSRSQSSRIGNGNVGLCFEIAEDVR